MPTPTEEVIKEFAPLGKYRVRLLKDPKRPKNPPYFDIREYVKSESFEGFTRRGIRLTDADQLDRLIDVCKEAKEMKPWPKPKKS
jgi:hypothetical protein